MTAIFCKHDWTNYGYSYIECKKCGRIKYNPKKNAEILEQVINTMITRKIWTEDDRTNLIMKSNLFQ